MRQETKERAAKAELIIPRLKAEVEIVRAEAATQAAKKMAQILHDNPNELVNVEGLDTHTRNLGDPPANNNHKSHPGEQLERARYPFGLSLDPHISAAGLLPQDIRA